MRHIGEDDNNWRHCRWRWQAGWDVLDRCHGGGQHDGRLKNLDVTEGSTMTKDVKY